MRTCHYSDVCSQADEQKAASSDIKRNYSRAHCHAAEEIRNEIVKFGKTPNPKDDGSTVTVQVISVTLMLVECPSTPATGDKTAEETNTPKIPGLAKLAGEYRRAS